MFDTENNETFAPDVKAPRQDKKKKKSKASRPGAETKTEEQPCLTTKVKIILAVACCIMIAIIGIIVWYVIAGKGFCGRGCGYCPNAKSCDKRGATSCEAGYFVYSQHSNRITT